MLLVPSAAGKGIGHLVFVGRDGAVVHVLGGDRLMQAGRASPAPKTGYLLVYPLLVSGLPAGTGRYYPAARVVCFSVFRVTRDLPCYSASAFLRTRLGAGSRLPRFTRAPTTIARLMRGAAVQPLNPVAGPTFELALASRSLSRPAAAPEPCTLAYTATWKGPDAATRPTQLCLTADGLYANGRVYPVSAAAYAKLAG
jgi:hypothetical protein